MDDVIDFLMGAFMWICGIAMTLLVVGVLLFVASCIATPAPSKRIARKDSAAGEDTHCQTVGKSTSCVNVPAQHFFLVANDRTMCKVEYPTWSRVEVGESWTCDIAAGRGNGWQ